jgi:lysophospholipase L1-like esterase
MRYIALGDAMSIDLYPRLDLEGQGRPRPSGAPGVGAASLFHHNDDDLWPALAGRDLAALHPGIRRVDLCADGATIGHTLDIQLRAVPAAAREDARVVTVTAGGNDLLGGLFDGMGGLERTARRAADRYGELVVRVLEAFRSATVILTTVYDPTDGTGLLPGVSDDMGPLPMELLGLFNDAVRSAAGAHPRTRLADVHEHFLGHGLSAPAGARWYWDPSPIEPGARGASEIRRCWLEALRAPAPSPPGTPPRPPV